MTPFEQLASDLDELAMAPARAASRAAPRLAETIGAQHQAGLAPDGSPWAPDKGGGVPRLADLGAPVGSARGSTVAITLPDAMRPHQAGGRIPQRKVLPAPGDELPDAYRAVLDQALAEEAPR